MFLSEKEFTESVRCLPLVSVDLCVITSNHDTLLVKRNCQPAKNFYFNPGGRIRKNESIEQAIERIARDEIGLSGLSRDTVQPMGAWDHFYENSAFDDSVSTHYVNLPHYLQLDAAQQELLSIEHGAGMQHDSFLWMPLKEAKNNPDVHQYSRNYAIYLADKLKLG